MKWLSATGSIQRKREGGREIKERRERRVEKKESEREMFGTNRWISKHTNTNNHNSLNSHFIGKTCWSEKIFQ